jgi:hypothetical protein
MKKQVRVGRSLANAWFVEQWLTDGTADSSPAANAAVRNHSILVFSGDRSAWT